MNEQPTPQPMAKGLLCPYCGAVSTNVKSCLACGGLFEPLSRQATQNSMGPWFIRDDQRPFMPGCSYEVIRALVRKGKIGPDTIIRGPTTNQFWAFARRAPGVAHLLGLCHACATRVPTDATRCPSCEAHFAHAPDRQSLGLGPVREVPSKPVAARPAAPSHSDEAPDHSHRGPAGIVGMVILLVLTTGGLAWAGYAALQWTESSSTAKAASANEDEIPPSMAQFPSALIQAVPTQDSFPIYPDGERDGEAQPSLASQAPSDDAAVIEARTTETTFHEAASAEPVSDTSSDINAEAKADPADTIQTDSQTLSETDGLSVAEEVERLAISPVEAAKMWTEESDAAPQSVELMLDDRAFVVERDQLLTITRPISVYVRLLTTR